MRPVVLGAALALISCAEPAAPVPKAAAGAPEEAPMPRRVPDGPHWRARQESHKTSADPILRALARREIRAGDPVEPLVRQNPHYRVARSGELIVMRYDPTLYGGTTLEARDGKLVSACTSSCTYRDVFFGPEAAVEAARQHAPSAAPPVGPRAASSTWSAPQFPQITTKKRW